MKKKNKNGVQKYIFIIYIYCIKKCIRCKKKKKRRWQRVLYSFRQIPDGQPPPSFIQPRGHDGAIFVPIPFRAPFTLYLRLGAFFFAHPPLGRVLPDFALHPQPPGGKPARGNCLIQNFIVVTHTHTHTPAHFYSKYDQRNTSENNVASSYFIGFKYRVIEMT